MVAAYRGNGWVIYLCSLMLQPFLPVIAWAVVLAILFHPLHQRIARKTGCATLSALMTSALVVLVFVVPLLFMAGIAVSQLLSATQSLQERLRGGADTPDVAVVSWVAGHLGIGGATVAGWLTQHTSELAGTVGQYTLSMAASVTVGIVSFGFIIVALFMMLLEGADLIAAVPDLLPFDPARSRRLLVRMKEVVQVDVVVDQPQRRPTVVTGSPSASSRSARCSRSWVRHCGKVMPISSLNSRVRVRWLAPAAAPSWAILRPSPGSRSRRSQAAASRGSLAAGR